MIIAPPASNQPQMGQATATIKTESGYHQVVLAPSIQHGGNSNQVGNSAIQIQKQIGGIGQQIIQPVVSVECILKRAHTLGPIEQLINNSILIDLQFFCFH